jgi:mRNA interferase MazF
MARILRGDIIWANLDPTLGHEQAGSRPVLILSENIFNDRSGTVIAVVLTSQQPGASFPLSFELSDTSLPKKSWVKISQIRTLSTQRLGKKIGNASDEELETIIEGLNEIIGGS